MGSPTKTCWVPVLSEKKHSAKPSWLEGDLHSGWRPGGEPQLSHRSGDTCGCFPFTAYTSPSDAARCSKAAACAGGPQLRQSSAVGRQQPAHRQRNQPSVSHWRPQRRGRDASGGGDPARLLCSPPGLAGALGHPQTEPPPDAEPPRCGVAGAEGSRYLSLPVPGCWPIDGGGVSRLGTGPGSGVPPGSPGDLGFPGSTPPAAGNPLAPAPPARSSPGHGEGSFPGKGLWILLPRRGKVARRSRVELWQGPGEALAFSSALPWRGRRCSPLLWTSHVNPS